MYQHAPALLTEISVLIGAQVAMNCTLCTNKHSAGSDSGSNFPPPFASSYFCGLSTAGKWHHLTARLAAPALLQLQVTATIRKRAYPRKKFRAISKLRFKFQDSGTCCKTMALSKSPSELVIWPRALEALPLQAPSSLAEYWKSQGKRLSKQDIG